MKKVLLFLFISILSMSLYAQGDSFTPHNDALKQATITVYPNPATNYIAVNGNQEEIKQVVIYNLIGRQVKSFIASPDEKYIVSELPKGMYLIQLLDKNNKVVTTQRVSKR